MVTLDLFQQVVYSGGMKQALKTIQLGHSHYYFLSEVTSFDLGQYEQRPQSEKDLICTAVSKFGEYPPKSMISETDGRRWFFGRMKYTASETARRMPPGKLVARLEDHVRELFMPIKNICDIFESGPSCFVTYEPKYANNADIITFENYIKMTR